MTLRKYPNIEFPRELDICLTNQCNLNCGYCYFADKKYKNPDWLTIEDIEKAFDLYLKHINPKRVQKISLTGGEPFLNFPLLSNSLKFARKSLGAKANIEIFTNGTFLSPHKAEVLLKENPMLIISMDGDKKAHDAARKFYDRKGKSVFNVVYKNIKNAGHDIISQCYCGVTFCGENIKRIYESIDFLLFLGFKGIRIDFDVLRIWKPEEINEIREEVLKIKKLYAKTVEIGFGDIRQRLIFDFIIPPQELKQIKNPQELREIALAPDKCFYPSGLAATYGNEKEIYRIGDIEKGFDYLKMDKVLRELNSYFSTNKRDGYNGCPTHIYFAARLNKKDPNIYFGPGEKFYNVLRKIVDPISDFENMLNFLASRSGFGDFEHKPKYTFNKEIAVFKADMSCLKINMADLRSGCDLFLYSPGEYKKLSIKIKGDNCGLDNLKALIIYVLMRADNLSKKVKIDLHSLSLPVSKEVFEFAREHGIAIRADLMTFLKVKSRNNRSDVPLRKVYFEINFKNYDFLARNFKKAVMGGVKNISLSFCQNGWNELKADKLSNELKKINDFLKTEIECERFVFVADVLDYLHSFPANCALSSIKMTADGKYYAGAVMIGGVFSGIKRKFFVCEFNGKNSKCAACFKSSFFGNISGSGIAAFEIFRQEMREFVSFVFEKSKSNKIYERYVHEMIRIKTDYSKVFKLCHDDKKEKY